MLDYSVDPHGAVELLVGTGKKSSIVSCEAAPASDENGTCCRGGYLASKSARSVVEWFGYCRIPSDPRLGCSQSTSVQRKAGPINAIGVHDETYENQPATDDNHFILAVLKTRR